MPFTGKGVLPWGTVYVGESGGEGKIKARAMVHSVGTLFIEN